MSGSDFSVYEIAFLSQCRKTIKRRLISLIAIELSSMLSVQLRSFFLLFLKAVIAKAILVQTEITWQLHVKNPSPINVNLSQDHGIFCTRFRRVKYFSGISNWCKSHLGSKRDYLTVSFHVIGGLQQTPLPVWTFGFWDKFFEKKPKIARIIFFCHV